MAAPIPVLDVLVIVPRFRIPLNLFNPPLRHQPAALVGRHLILLDSAPDGCFSIGRITDDAHQLRGRALNVVDGPRLGLLLLFGRSLGHESKSIATAIAMVARGGTQQINVHSLQRCPLATGCQPTDLGRPVKMSPTCAPKACGRSGSSASY